MQEAARRGAHAPMRICMVITSFHPIVGGAERQVAALASLMIEEGHEVRVVTRRYPGLPAEERLGDIPVHRVSAPGPRRLGSLRFLLGAIGAIRALRPDVIHCHSLFAPALAGCLAHRPGRAALFVKPMSSGEATSVAAKPGGRLRLATLNRRAERIIAVSGEIERELLGLGTAPAKIRRIPNGVDVRRFRPCPGPEERSALRSRLGLGSGPIFVFAGRIARQKRLPMLLKAWPAVVAGAPGASLLIAGANRATPTGDQADVGDAEAIDRTLLDQPGIRHLGHVDAIEQYLQAADVFVLPSAREGLSNALLEACASGLAVIAADIGGAEDLVRSGENGLLFARDDAAALAEAMVSLAEDPVRRAALGMAARATAVERFDLRTTASRLLEEYATVLGQPAAAPARFS